MRIGATMYSGVDSRPNAVVVPTRSNLPPWR